MNWTENNDQHHSKISIFFHLASITSYLLWLKLRYEQNVLKKFHWSSQLQFNIEIYDIIQIQIYFCSQVSTRIREHRYKMLFLCRYQKLQLIIIVQRCRINNQHAIRDFLKLPFHIDRHLFAIDIKVGYAFQISVLF